MSSSRTVAQRMSRLVAAGLIAWPMHLMAQNFDSALLNSAAPDRTAKLVAAAKVEGSLTMYTSIAEKDLKPIIEPFEKKFGIKVNTWRASGDSVLNRTLNENRANATPLTWSMPVRLNWRPCRGRKCCNL